jgi:hypothetical protein
MDLVSVDMQIFPVAAPHISNDRPFLETIKKLFDFRPGFVPSVAEVGSNLIVYVIDIFLLDISCLIPLEVLILLDHHCLVFSFTRYFLPLALDFLKVFFKQRILLLHRCWIVTLQV